MVYKLFLVSFIGFCLLDTVSFGDSSSVTSVQNQKVTFWDIFFLCYLIFWIGYFIYFASCFYLSFK